MNPSPDEETSPFAGSETQFRPVVEHVTVTDESRLQKWAIAILFPYAVMMTIFAVVFYFKSRNVEAIHPLMMIPDLDGEYRNATQRKKTAGSEHRIRFPPDTPLGTDQVTSIGQPIRIGCLEVTPVSVVQEQIVGFSFKKGATEPESRSSKEPGLILKLKLRNVAEDVTLYPCDPYFVRRPRDTKDKPYMMVEVGDKRFYGGALSYVTDSDVLIREWVQGQENDDQPLAPGEERVTVVCTSPKDPVIAAITEYGSAMWRVQLRRGFVAYRDKEYSVSAVIGVRFRLEDIQQASGEKKS